MSRATHSATKQEALEGRKWWVVDGADQTVGRLATRIASILKGKHKPSYTPSIDTGDFVVVVNAGKVKFTPLSAKDRFEPLKTGDIAILAAA